MRFQVATLVRRRAMVLPVPTGVAQKSSNVGASHHQRCSKKQLRWCFIPPPLHKKAAALLPHTTNSAQKSSSVGASYHLHCTKKQRRCYLAPPTVPKKAATVVPGGSNVGGGGINGFLVADGDQPLSVASRHIGRVPARRPAHFFASPKKWARKAPPPNRPSAQASLDQPTALRCSQQAAGAELAGCAHSDSCAGLPRLLLRCSAVRKGLSADTEPLLERRGSSTSWFGSVGDGCGCCRTRPWDVGLRPAG